MTKQTRKVLVAWLLIGLVVVLANSPQVRTFVNFPTYLRVTQGQDHTLDINLPLELYIKTDGRGLVEIAGEVVEENGWKRLAQKQLTLRPLKTGRTVLNLSLLGGMFQWRQIVVDVVPRMEVMAGGHSIGVLVRSKGLLVTGHAAIENEEGRSSPAFENGIVVGDVILQADGQVLRNAQQLAALVDQAGRRGSEVNLTIRRKNLLIEKTVRPVKHHPSGKYRIGLYVKDGTAGVGTLTYYDPKTRIYGALGHSITDGKTNLTLDLREGSIVEANISGIQTGSVGHPGEKLGVFAAREEPLGNIEKNTRFGIIGDLNTVPENPLFPTPVPIALMGEVKTGPAEIITVVKGKKLQRFEVKIREVFPQPNPAEKGLILEITDPNLLRITGGIIQGMSGSPIIQDNRLVGAVTHVMVNNPTRGYGVFIEWMLAESGLLPPEGSAARNDTGSKPFRRPRQAA